MKYEFKKIFIDDKTAIEGYVEKFLPYSDFNFISLLTYDTQETTEFCFSDSNLIVRFEDYDTNENFLSLLGNNNVYRNIHALIEYSQLNDMPAHLKLVPEVVIQSMSEQEKMQLELIEDRDNFDYIVSAQDVAELSHERFPRKRHLIDRFIGNYPEVISQIIDLSDESNRSAILSTFKQWQEINYKSDEEINTEYIAVKRLLDNQAYLPNLHAIGLYDAGKLIAFNTFDIATKEYGVSSFQKANKTYEGIYAFLTTHAAQQMVKLGVTYINYEQDLGIEGLRSSKLSWHPLTFFKKYTVSLNNNREV